MEINTEINKVFGQEMARLFADTISEEELKQQAAAAWMKLKKAEGWRSESALDKQVRAMLGERFNAAVAEVLDSEPVKSDIQAQARRIVADIRIKAEEKIVEAVSDRIASMTAGYSNFGIRDMIAYTVRDMFER